ncbi:MAG TPA: LysE family transporter [Gemmatimonadales bacterium]
MDWGLIGRGFVLGFAVAAPVGPIGVLVIRRTLSAGSRTGFVSGLGAATADATYGSVAALGLTAATSALVAHADLLRLGGGLFLCWFGIRTILARPAEAGAAAGAAPRLWAAYGSTLLLTITNPITILSFAAAFAGLGLANGVTGPATGLSLVASVFAGSTFWWALLSGGVGVLRGSLGVRALRVVNWVAGLLLIGFGLVAVVGFRR